MMPRPRDFLYEIFFCKIVEKHAIVKLFLSHYIFFYSSVQWLKLTDVFTDCDLDFYTPQIAFMIS